MPVLAAGKLHGLREQPFLDVVVDGLYAYAEHLGHIGAGHEAEFLAIRHGIADAVVMPGLGPLFIPSLHPLRPLRPAGAAGKR